MTLVEHDVRNAVSFRERIDKCMYHNTNSVLFLFYAFKFAFGLPLIKGMQMFILHKFLFL